MAHFDIYITASHLPGVINVTADHLSRGYMCQAFEVTPTLAQHPAIIPSAAFRLISPHTRLDTPRFSSIVPTNSIMHLLKRSSLLCTYMSQMYPHADAQYDHTIILVLLLP